MYKNIQDYKWSYLRKLKEVSRNNEFFSSPLNAIKTMKIIELNAVCEFVSRIKKDDKSNSLYEELRRYLRSNKALILNATTICPGVNIEILNNMTNDLLNDELTDEEKIKLFNNEKESTLVKKIKI